MMSSHFLRSMAKLVLVVPSTAVRPRAENMTSAAPGVLDQPFCGALMSTSTPQASMSTQIAPDAMQSSTKRPPCS